jgi:KDO2-lipid IV(A) lauroyltransferase
MAAIRLLQGLLRPVPLRAASWLGAGLGWFLFHGLRLERRTTLESLAIAFGDRLDPAARWRLAARCYRHFGSLIAEFLCLPRVPRDDLSPYVVLDNPELLDAALAQGKGALVVSGHLGNWELLSMGLAAHRQPYAAYVGRQHNARADDYINAMRERMGVGTISKQAAMRGMLRALKAGGTLGIAADQHFSRNRHFVRFFGRPVSAAPGPASLIQHTGVPALFGEAYKVGRFRYRVRLTPLPVPPPSGNDELDLLRITQAFFDLLEGAVRRHPEQYFWMHRRWRAPPRAADLSETNRAFLRGEPPPGAAGAAAAPRRSVP